MKTFNIVIKRGRVYCKLSIINIISPHTLISDITAGIVNTKINIIILNRNRIFDNNSPYRVLLSFGHKPIIFNMLRFRLIAHSKSV
ncbi:hypothetical protein ALC57_06634 [Trachymyrmex cornetzi]|uniref:Uncharacterized protein n=1 Tax=Trachymyrmex cornetzi TaxID=471704 RepID=A0A195E6C8_9HYME|nr:hypothetical protein ALC57_06634 [Trachymyrmex cornetzi]